ncbi:MAG TPA: hypothetical protein VNT99_11485 [Methylomirabilota bacterium]|nr:hypothetical protein [Methylomirabilota bacterium]
MAVFLIIAGCIWFGLGAIFVLSMMCAARRGIPWPRELSQHELTSDTSQDSAAHDEESGAFTVRASEAPQPLADEVVT